MPNATILTSLTRQPVATRRGVLTAAIAMLALTARSGSAGEALRDVSLPLAADLARDTREAAASGRAVLVFYTLPGCPWCERLRREYLGAMARDPEDQKRVIVREIDITSQTPLIAPDGSATTHKAFAAAHKIRFTPTTTFLARDGSAAAEAIVGYPPGGFYGAYLEQRIETARKKG